MKHKGPCYVYRLFDAGNKLLYVGCSTWGLGRVIAHGSAGWFIQVTKATLERFSSLEEARSREAKYIKSEHPRYNIQSNSEKYEPCRRCGGTGQVAEGKDMRKLRKEARFSMSSVAIAMGVSISYLCDLEHDRKPWTADLETRFKKALK